MTPFAVIDANILISYLLGPDNENGTIVRLFESISSGTYRLVWSERLAGELRSSVQRKSYLRSRIASGDLEQLIGLLEEVSISFSHAEEFELPVVLRDPKDNYLLDIALGAQVDYLVTGDRDLLDIRMEIDRPQIVTAVEFLELLSSSLDERGLPNQMLD